MTNSEWLASERLDDLLTNDLKIIQSSEVFSFSMDAVLLAHFCSVPPSGKVVDLCTGNGVIPLLLSTRTKASVVGVEIQPRLADMASRSVELNGLTGQIRIVCGDLRDVHLQLGNGAFDLVTVNPPYLPLQSGDISGNSHLAAARHELHGDLDSMIQAACRLVRAGGKVAFVYRPFRLVDLLIGMRRHRLEPKRLRYVHPRVGSEANMVLVEAIRDGRAELRTLAPCIVHNEDGSYSEELQQIHYGRRGLKTEG
jgi:tRNA1(Val) A37 N6-methylase TrmN6